MTFAPEGSHPNPFPGLRAFQSDEDHLFFGREEQTARLLGILREQRFVAVVGASGSGKSSLVRAGLIPSLHGGTMAQGGTHWEVVLLRPGGDPLHNLAAGLIEADLYDAADPETLPRLEATLSRSRFGLSEAVRQSDRRDAGSNLVIVVDQFEELFRFRGRDAANEEASEAFIKLLLTASREGSPRVYVVLTMRSDYLGDCAQIQGLAEAVNQSEYLIPRLTRNQQRAAIEKPVGVGGARIAPRLVQNLLNDVGSADDQLPVLQHALMRTWDEWVRDHAPDEPVDLRHYEATGGMAESLSRHADEVFASLPSDAHREVCARLFKALTMTGADNRGIRRPTRLEPLARIAAAGEAAVRAVVEAYRQPGVTFLMPGVKTPLDPESVIDLSHESLMRVWRRLSAWVEEESQSARIHRRLAETAALWQKGRAGHYHDPDLQIASTWRDEARPNAEWAEQYGGGFEAAMAFLDQSREVAQAEELARETARRRELEQAKRLAEAERHRLEAQERAARRLRVFAAGLGVVAALAVVASIVAIKAWNLAAEKEQAASESASALKRTLVASDFAQGVERLEKGNGAEGISYLARALRTEPGFWPAAMRAESSLASGRFPLRVFDPLEPSRVITSFQWNDREDLLFSSDAAGDVAQPENLVWDARNGKRLYQVAAGKKLSADTSWTPDGRHLVIFTLEESLLRTLEARTGKEVGRAAIPSGLSSFRTGQHPLAGALVLGRHPDGSLQIWKAATGESATPRLARPPAALDDFGVTPDGRRVYGVYGDSTIALWDALTGASVTEILTAPHRLRPGQPGGAVIFSPDGEVVVTRAEGSRRFNWWRVGKGSEAKPDVAGASWLELPAPASAVLLPGGRKVAFIPLGTAAPLRVVVHDLVTRAETARIESAQPLGQLILATRKRPEELSFAVLGALEGNLVRLWDLESGVRLTEIVLPSPIAQAELSPEGRRLLTTSTANDVMLWDVFTGQQLLPRPLEHEGLPAAWLSPDGEKLVTFDPKKLLLRAWDSRSGRGLIEPIPQWLVSGMYFPDGGRRLLVHELGRTAFGPFDKQTTGRFRLFDLDPRPDLHEPILDDTGFSRVRGNAACFVAGGKDLMILGPRREEDPDEILLYDAASRRLRQAIRLPAGVRIYYLGNFVRPTVLSPDGSRLLASCSDHSLRVWDLARGELLLELGHEDDVEGFAMSPDNSRIATGTVSGKVRVWDAASGALLVGPLDHGDQHVHGIRFRPDGALAVSTSVDLRVRFFDPRTGKAPFDPIAVDNVFEVANNGLFSPDGTHFAPLPVSPSIPMIDTATGKVLHTLRHPLPCSAGAFSPDGRLLAIGTRSNTGAPAGAVHLWDWRAGMESIRPLDAGAPVECIDFSRDGKLLATGTGQGAVQVWEVESGLPLIDAVSGRGSVETVSFNPEGTELVAAWRLGSVRVVELPARDGARHEWLPRFCEAIAGRSLAAGGTSTEAVTRGDLDALRAELRSSGPSSDTTRSWAEWFFAEPEERTISPGSKVLLRDDLARLRRSSLAGDVRGALRLDPTDALTHGRLGILLAQELASGGELHRQADVNAALRRHWEETAAWYGRRATELEPANVEAWTFRADLLARLGRTAEASSASARATDLVHSTAAGSSPNILYLRAVSLGSEGKWAEADASFSKAMEGLLASAEPDGASGRGRAPLLGLLAEFEPRRDAAGLRDLRLPPPIPGTFEDFETIPEGQIPRGWTVRHAPLEMPRLPAAAGRLDMSSAEVFEDWTSVAVDRVLATADLARSTGAPYWKDRLLALHQGERVNGLLPSALLQGRFLYALSGGREGASQVQEVITPDYDCSGRSSVQVSFHSAYEQSDGAAAGLEYSIDQGQTWIPILYRLPRTRIVRDRAGRIDGPASLEAVRFTPPFLSGAEGGPRGATFGSLIGASLDRGLDRSIEGLSRGSALDGKRVESFRLERADGRARVRLRFLQVGRGGWYWGIDDFGLYEIPGDAVSQPPPLVDWTRDPEVLSATALRLATSGGEARILRTGDAGGAMLAQAANLAMPVLGSVAPQALGPVAPLPPRHLLDAQLLAGRALSLAPEEDTVLARGLVVSTFAGAHDESQSLARKLLAKGAIGYIAASALVPFFRRQGEILEARGEVDAAAIAYEATLLLSQAALGSLDQVAMARLAALGLLAHSVILVPRGSQWRYLDDGRDPGTAWRDPVFEDRAWLSGKARLGYGGDGETTIVGSGPSSGSRNITTYFRAPFQAEDLGGYVLLRLSVARDDGVAVYLNGREVVHDNLPEGLIGPGTLATESVGDDAEKQFFVFNLPVSMLRAGRKGIAAEVHQSSATSSDLGFDLELEGVGGLKSIARDRVALEDIAEKLGLPVELRGALWVSRAERDRRAAHPDRAAEALALAARLDPANPAFAYEKSLQLAARGEAAAARESFLAAAGGAIALKSAPRGARAMSLPETLRILEPIVSPTGLAIAAAAERVLKGAGSSRELEAGWLLGWSETLDRDGHEARLERVEVLQLLGKLPEALAAADLALAAGPPPAGAPPRAIRERKEWLQVRERLLRQLGRSAEADLVRGEIFAIPPRDPAWSGQAIDLSSSYNGSLYDGRDWHGNENLKVLAETFRPRDGIRFDLRGLVQLNSGPISPDPPSKEAPRDLNTRYQKSFPDAAEKIAIGQPAKGLHFLVGCIQGKARAGTEVGRIVIHYQDGSEAVLPLVYGEDLTDWANLADAGLAPDRVAWVGGRPLRLIDRKSWSNPAPERPIASFDFLSAKREAAPFLIAATAE